MAKMTSNKLKNFWLALGLVAASGGAHAAEWGLRGGLSDDPDQIVFGAHLFAGTLGEFRFVPSAELGAGDDTTVLQLTAPLLYDFKPTRDRTIFYAGGGVVGGLVDPDDDDTDSELGVKAIGGLKRPLRNGNEFFVELNLLANDDLPDFAVLAGVTFKARQ